VLRDHSPILQHLPAAPAGSQLLTALPAQVAQELGLRSFSHRRPAGFWDDLTHLDQELSLLIAASWVRLERHEPVLARGGGGDEDCDEDDLAEWYYYNTVIRRAQLEAPEAPREVEDSGGGTLFVDSEAERLMPSRQSVLLGKH